MDALAKFKIRKDAIYIVFDNDASFDDVLADFKDKLEDAKKIFKQEKTSLLFSGREFNTEEENIIYETIENAGLNLIAYANECYLDGVMPTISDTAVTEKSKDLQEEYDPQKQPTFFQNGSLRSGRRIEFDGSVVLLGDLNAGAEIIASGNIIVLGACRGMVHAGSRGDSNSYIFAQQLTPTQIRIAEMVTYLNFDRKDEHFPSYAYIDDGKIYVAKI